MPKEQEKEEVDDQSFEPDWVQIQKNVDEQDKVKKQELLKIPDWLKNEVTATLWTEDDSGAIDRQTANEAWQQHFGYEIPSTCDAYHDGGDAFYYGFRPNKVLCLSYPGNCEIYVLTKAGIAALRQASIKTTGKFKVNK